MRFLLAILAFTCGAALAGAAKPTRDPTKEMVEQRAAIAELLKRGEKRERVCAIVAERFSVRCVVNGNDFILSRGVGTSITYLATLRMPSK